MSSIARREFVATLASLAGTVLPFSFGNGGGGRDDETGTRTADSSTVLTGVVDRIEGEDAVVLIERAERVVDDRLVPVGRLPATAREEDAVLSLTLADGDIERLRYDAAASRRRRAAAQKRFDELAEDGPP